MPRNSSDAYQFGRYLVNGLFATAVHFGGLHFLIEVQHLPSAGLANGIAAVAGVSISFIGSRYFVFRRSDSPMLGQIARFFALYAMIAALHASVLWGWSDIAGWDYRLGFLLASALRMGLSYIGNKAVVFRSSAAP